MRSFPVLLASLLLAACGQGPVLAIEVGQAPKTMQVGESVQLTAVVSGAGDGPTRVEWLTSAPAIAAVSASGVVTALAPGVVTVTARVTQAPGLMASASVQLSVLSMPGPRCGDATCDAAETCGSCAADCGACPVTTHSLFPEALPPAVEEKNDGRPIEVGLRFRASTPGRVTALRAYRPSASVGVRTASLWRGDGSALASAPLPAASSSGWQEVVLATPVALTPGTTYVVSVHAPSGDYVKLRGGLAQAVSSGPLRALADGEDGANGLYRYSPTPAFPTEGHEASNYFLDVVFATSGAAQPDAGALADAGLADAGARPLDAGSDDAGGAPLDAGPTTPLTFAIIPTSEPDLVAPFRGALVWHDDFPTNIVNNPTEAMNVRPHDFYARSNFPWWALESAQGVYDFSRFDALVRQAIDNKQKFAFSLMALIPGNPEGPVDQGARMTYPLYLHQLMQAEAPNSRDWVTPQENHWVPNYNSPSFQARVRALLQAIRAHFDTTLYRGVRYRDVIAYVDIGLFGSWGEWNHSNVVSQTSDWPAGRLPTAQAMRFIIDQYIDAFQDHPLIIGHAVFDGEVFQNVWIPAEVGHHALTARNRWGLIGWKRDNWGWRDGYISYNLENNPATYQGLSFAQATMERWKFAPIGGEPPCGGATAGGAFPYWDLPRQIAQYHASFFGNGNYCGELTSLQVKDTIREAFKAAGYRIILEGGSLSAVRANGPLQVTLDWKNVGIAPVYETWEVRFELQNRSTGAVVWSGASSHQLKLWLPQPTASRVTDTFRLPAVPSGSYRLVLKVRDPSGYRDPLPLALRGRLTDGSYLLRDSLSL